MSETAIDGVAIVGMAGRFPGAASIDELWANLLAGRESITRFSPDELSPLVPAELRAHPRYVPARGVVADADRFDAAFFGIGAREAQLIDPQQRVFLELCWNALEHAGIDPARAPGSSGPASIGVFAGTSNNGYRKLVEARPDVVAAAGEFAAMLANEKDYVATRVAHKLGLTGPAISLYTACSTSLVAIAQAWYALMSWQCDVALAGGVNIAVPQESGYLPAEGAIESADGHCRPFDADASGTVFSSGAGVVVLKRLADAIEHGDTIWAVIRGVGVNNDGADKASFSAPSVRGQSAAIRLALSSAGVDAASIGYVEAHGTGTPLGDPIEVEALARAFAAEHGGGARHTCWIGSLKGNLGHLVAASGVTGLIKATLALHHGRIPASLHYRTPNPEIDFAATPFKVVQRAKAWPRKAAPRRAGVSSFGVGGTNAHVVLEEAPRRAPSSAGRAVTLLTLSARDGEALQRRAAELADALAAYSDADLADIGATLAFGRKAMATRGTVVARTIAQARERLARLGAARARQPKLVFLFPGQGSQHAGMARELVETESVFREHFERCCALASRHLGLDLRAAILPAAGEEAHADAQLAQTRCTQPALFAVEYALARWWESIGVVADAMIGHSVGEYVAATLAGVFTLEDAVALVCARGSAMQAQPAGAMLAVRAAEHEVLARLPADVSLAAVNAPELVTVAGDEAAVDAFARALDAERIASTRLKVSHAFHSAAMDGALPLLARAFETVRPAPPTRPFHSCVSGRPIGAAEAVDPSYWLRQLREPVRFADALGDVLAGGPVLFVEVGPSQALTTFARARLRDGDAATASLGAATRQGSDAEHLAAAVGECWRHGREPDWDAYHAGQTRHRVVLPGYPFRGERYWIETPAPATIGAIGVVEMNPPATASAAPAASPRGARLRAELRELVEGLSGEPVDAAQDGATLLELGLDSLALTQAALELERRYGLKLKFRRLMEDLDSIDKLAALLETTLPPEPPAAAATAVAAPLATPPAPVGGSPLLTQLIQSQMALMQQQTQLLAALAGNAVVAPAPVAAVVAAPAARSEEAAANLVERPFGASARISLKRDLALDAGQRTFVDAFTRDYNRRTAGSKAFSQQHRARMADPRVVTGFNPLWKELVYPIVVERSKGARLWDVDGNEYVDCLNAFGANFLGYQPDYVVDALKRQIDAGFEVGPQHPLTAEVSELIAGMTGMERVAFCNTGSEAVMGAMRIARTVTGRKTIAIFTNSYHGIFDEVIVRGTRSLRSIAAAPGILASAVENVLVLDYGSEESLRILRERAHELAAILIEPVQGKNPSLQPREFVRALRPICDAGGCALIFDEVITGFRIAPGGAQEFYGVRADLATYGKIIGGGLPFAAIAGSAHWMDALDGGDWRFGDDSYPEAGVTYFAGTFVRHPLALAAAKAALLHLKAQGPALQQRLNERTAALVERLDAIFAAHGAPLKAVGFSSLWRVVADEGQPFASLFWYALRANGLHVYEQFNCFLTEAHGEADVERIVAGVEAATAMLMRERLLTAGDGAGEAPIAAPAVLPDTLPLTQGQLEKWLGGQYGGDAALACNEAVVMRYDGDLDVAALRRALERVWSRHEAFGLAIGEDGTQSLRAAPPLPLRELDFSGGDAEARLEAHCRDAMREPFDLGAPPLLRLSLIRLGERRHALHLIAHHLVMDGWSLAVFFDELETAYNAFAAGREPSLPPAQSYRAYVLAEQERRRSNAAQVDYWRERHRDPPPPLGLPVDRPRGEMPDFRADSERHAFAPELADALRQAARRRGVTVYGLLLAAFAAWLARVSGRRDVAVAIPFAGQALAGSGALIGDGVNTLPLRIAIDETAPLDALVGAAQRALLDAAEHQDLTLLDVVRSLGPRRRDAQSALADVVFNLNPRVRAPAYDGVAASWQDCRHAALLWELFFNLNDDGRSLNLDVHYRTALHDAATIRAWIADFERMLAAFAQPQPAPLAALLRQTIPAAVDSVVAPQAPASADTPLALIETQVRRTPARIAIEGEGGTLSYAQLWRDSGAFAARLRAAGVARGDLVGVCLPRRIDLLPALLGVLRAGAAYVPLDPAFPDARLRTMIGQAALRHVVVGEGAQVPAAIDDGSFARIAYAASSSGVADAQDLPAVTGDDLAYVLFTSGSTGVPKGVRVLHRNLANFLVSMRAQPGLDAGDVLAAVTTLSFDIAGLELYLPLTVGARVHLVGEAQVRDPLELARALGAAQASVLQTTPTLLRLLLDGAGDAAVRGLRLLVGGEALPRDLAERALAQAREVWNLYGPTETTIWSTLARVESGSGPVPLGRPIANTTIHLLDAELKPVESGTEGELWIGGDGVADGYLGRPDLSAERFRLVDGHRLYRTGDLGSLRDGVLHFHGRGDDQIKLRGHRIELGEIEAAARAEAGVREAAAAVRRLGENDERLVLYVGAPTAAGDLAQRLRERLRETLPAYMQPQQIDVLAVLPKTPNGKLDRNALAASVAAPPAPSADLAAAAAGDAREIYLGRIWGELIGLDELRSEDNFFELGGHSLLAVEMATRVQRDTGVRLNLMAVATGTLGSLARQLPETDGHAPAPSLLGRLFGRGGRGRTSP